MDTYGVFTVSILVAGTDSRIRRIRLFAVPCERTECEDIYAQFLKRNARLNKSDLDAVFAPETVRII